jgi:hypothetical protein
MDRDPEIELIFAFWSALDNAMFGRRPGDKGSEQIDRLLVKPWLSTDPVIRKAWVELTDPLNLSALEKWGCSSDMNPDAREATDAALKECRERAAKGA